MVYKFFLTVSGNLTDCYDELGNRYQLPVYLLSNPINFIDEAKSPTSGANSGSAASNLAAALQNPESLGKPVQYKIRISSLPQDYHFVSLRGKSTVYHGKFEVHKVHGVDIKCQRWFYGGKVLVDSCKLKDLKITEDYLIQVIDVSPLKSFGDDNSDSSKKVKTKKDVDKSTAIATIEMTRENEPTSSDPSNAFNGTGDVADVPANFQDFSNTTTEVTNDECNSDAKVNKMMSDVGGNKGEEKIALNVIGQSQTTNQDGDGPQTESTAAELT